MPAEEGLKPYYYPEHILSLFRILDKLIQDVLTSVVSVITKDVSLETNLTVLSFSSAAVAH